ncbi:MAG: hypothetical protein U5K75_02980 [Ahrensia sp.]|nr:hypothetical protein [Ahrensia sp.]
MDVSILRLAESRKIGYRRWSVGQSNAVTIGVGVAGFITLKGPTKCKAGETLFGWLLGHPETLRNRKANKHLIRQSWLCRKLLDHSTMNNQ